VPGAPAFRAFCEDWGSSSITETRGKEQLDNFISLPSVATIATRFSRLTLEICLCKSWSEYASGTGSGSSVMS